MMGLEKFALCMCMLLAIWAESNAILQFKQVQVLFRHGARTPGSDELKMMENPNASLTEPFGVGELTNKGKMQMYDLGLMLRERYNYFLGKEYKPDQLYARSSDVGRTKASLQLLLAGLYPPVSKLVWNSDLLWQPIPFDAVPRKLDNLFFLVRCPKYKSLREAYMEKQEKAYQVAHKRLHQYMKLYSSEKYTLEKFFLLNNLLNIQKSFGQKLPSWYKETTHAGITAAAKDHLESLSGTPELIQLNGGGIAKRIIENMNLFGAQSKPPPKMVLYSGHEFTVYALAKAHSITLRDSPEFGSAIIVEKLEDDEDGQQYIRVFYWTGAETKELQPLKLKCGAVCEVNEYLNLLNPMLPSDEDMLCLARNAKPTDFA